MIANIILVLKVATLRVEVATLRMITNIIERKEVPQDD